MFTGIVEELGSLSGRDGRRFTFAAEKVLADVEPGGSIAVNGCCLTVVAAGPGWWSADVVDETVSRTTLGDLAPADPVNLERPVRLADRLGGHLVQGHVDGVGTVVAPSPALEVRLPAALLRYVVEKGSVAVDGCSLTVTGVTPASAAESGSGVFSVAVIPHTADVTTLGRRRTGDRVNVEVDLMAKYAEKLLRGM